MENVLIFILVSAGALVGLDVIRFLLPPMYFRPLLICIAMVVALLLMALL
ncbi:MAG: hypothetical protein VKI63_05975 [Cyanobium sp.]|nr:hypothetical protein [Cyanobium sp.]